MIIFGKTLTQPNFLMKKLPLYFKTNDTYKDANDEGLLERYLEVLCNEVDDNFSPYIDEVGFITDIEKLPDLTTENKYELMEYITSLFGNPPDVSIGTTASGGLTEYIKLIRYIMHILRTKGTLQSIEYYLAIYHYEISTFNDDSLSLNKYDEDPTPIQYDSGAIYDSGYISNADFSLVITDMPGTTTKNPTQIWLDDYLKKSIQTFLIPFGANLGSLTYI